MLFSNFKVLLPFLFQAGETINILPLASTYSGITVISLKAIVFFSLSLTGTEQFSITVSDMCERGSQAFPEG